MGHCGSPDAMSNPQRVVSGLFKNYRPLESFGILWNPLDMFLKIFGYGLENRRNLPSLKLFWTASTKICCWMLLNRKGCLVDHIPQRTATCRKQLAQHPRNGHYLTWHSLIEFQVLLTTIAARPWGLPRLSMRNTEHRRRRRRRPRRPRPRHHRHHHHHHNGQP